MRTKYSVVAACSALCASALVSRAGLYSVTDLGSLGTGLSSSASGINDLGQAVGYSYYGTDGFYHATLFNGGTVKDLGTLGGATSFANAINNSGQIVGQADLANLSGNSAFLTTVTNNGALTNLGTLPLNSSGGSSFPSSSANALNNLGAIVGSSNIAPTNPPGNANAHAASFSSTASPVDLGSNDATLSSVANAVNNLGVAGGAAFLANVSQQHAALFQNGTVNYIGNLGAPGERYSIIYALNDTGSAAGTSQIDDTTGVQHAFLYKNGAFTDLGTLGGAGSYSYAYGINNAGAVVGDSEYASYTGFPEPLYHPFLYANGIMTDLNNLNPAGSPFVSLDDAYAINNLGQIVGDGTLANGDSHAFILTAVPEPTSVFVLTAATIGVALRRRPRRVGTCLTCSV